MNNSPHNDQGFPDTECLTEQQMLDYTGNKLTPRERHMVEKHALECEMCADALEGFALIKDHSKLDETVFAVNAMITGQPVKAEKRTWWDTRMKVAASVAILVLLGAVYYFQGKVEEQTEKAFAQNFEAYPPSKEKEKLKENNTELKTADTRIQNTAATPSEKNLRQDIAPGSGEMIAGNISLKQEDSDKDANYKDEAPKAATLVSGEGTDKFATAPSAAEAAVDANDMAKDERNSFAITAKDEAVEENAKKPALVLDNVASTGNNSNNNGFVVDQNTSSGSGTSNSALTTSPGASTYTWSGNSGTTLTPTYTNPLSTQKLSVKQDAYAKQLKRKPEDKTMALEKTKSRSNSSSSMKRSEIESETQTGKKNEAPGKEAPASNYETIVDTESSEQLNEKSRMDTVSVPSPFTAAMQKYQAGRHSEALPLFEQTLTADPSNVQALFYSSVSYLAVNKPDKALANLDKVLAAKNHSLTDPAKWYKALAYLKKGDRKAAKTLLQQIEKENGTYRQKAAEALKDLD